MELTHADRAMNEPKRTAGDLSGDVWSNYYFCPTLCRNCIHFHKEISNWPFHCTAGSSFAVSQKSKQEGYRQYDDCKMYKEKEEKSSSKSNYAADNNESILMEKRRPEPEKEDKWRREDEPREQKEPEEEREEESSFAKYIRERDERKRQEEEEWERQWKKEQEEEEFKLNHCFICAKTGRLVDFLGHKFHKPCLEEFKQSEDGKKWIKDEEAKLAKIAEAARKAEEKRQEEEKKHQEWLESPEGQKHLAEQERIKKEADVKRLEKERREDEERQAEEKREEEKRKHQEWLKTEEGLNWLGTEEGLNWLEDMDGWRWRNYSPEGEKWTAEQTRIKKEEEEKKQLEEEKAEKLKAAKSKKNFRIKSMLSWLFAIANCIILYFLHYENDSVVTRVITFLLLVIASKILMYLFFSLLKESKTAGKIGYTLVFVVIVWPLFIIISFAISVFALSIINLFRAGSGINIESNIVK